MLFKFKNMLNDFVFEKSIFYLTHEFYFAY